MSSPAAKARARAILKRIKGIENPVVVELGVFVGALSWELLSARPDLTLVMVDCWGENDSDEYKDTNDFHANASQDQQKGWEQQCRDRVKGFGSRAKIVKGLTTEMAKQFKREFDLVFVDADHSYKGCRDDILAWKSKVKTGGYMAGHDYENNEGNFKFGVTEAVDEIYGKGKVELDENYTWFKRV